MNKATTKRGFTLIEVMLTISIVGILATVKYARFYGEREKALDSSIVSSMQGILIEAALYKSRNGNYNSFCADTTTKLDELLAKVTEDAPTPPVCEDDHNQYGVIVELHSGEHYCIDSSKAFGINTVNSLTGKQCAL